MSSSSVLRRTGLILLIAGVLAVTAGAALAKPTVRLVPNFKAWKGERPFHGCADPHDSVTLLVKRETGTVLKKALCSLGGKARAEALDDATDRAWVLLETSERRGTRGGTDWLTVIRVTDHLTQRQRIRLTEAGGRYDYTVNRPASGGLELVLRLRVDGTGEVVSKPDQTIKLIRIPAP